MYFYLSELSLKKQFAMTDPVMDSPDSTTAEQPSAKSERKKLYLLSTFCKTCKIKSSLNDIIDSPQGTYIQDFMPESLC